MSSKQIRAEPAGRPTQPYDRQNEVSSTQENVGAGGEYRGDVEFGGFSDQDYGSQGYSGQGYGDRSYGDPDYGGQAFARRSSDAPEAPETRFGDESALEAAEAAATRPLDLHDADDVEPVDLHDEEDSSP